MIAGKLEPDKLIVGHVLIEGFDHEIPVVIGTGTIAVKLISATLGVANRIEPVPRPAFAIALAGQELIDQFGVGIGGGILDERIDLLGSGRKSKQIVIRAANEFLASNHRIGCELLFHQAIDDEAIHRRFGPCTRLGFGGRMEQGAERPVPLALFHINEPLGRTG